MAGLAGLACGAPVAPDEAGASPGAGAAVVESAILSPALAELMGSSISPEQGDGICDWNHSSVPIVVLQLSIRGYGSCALEH